MVLWVDFYYLNCSGQRDNGPEGVGMSRANSLGLQSVFPMFFPLDRKEMEKNIMLCIIANKFPFDFGGRTKEKTGKENI